MRKLLVILLTIVVATSATPPEKESWFHKRQTPGQYVEQVTNFFSQHRWAKGKELLDEGLELYPGDAPLHYLAGRYWYNGKNWDKARYHLVKACKINYHYVDAKQLLVNVEEITGNYSSAICYVNELLEVNPYWKGLWLRKVDLYKKMGNFEEANILLQRLSIIYPNDASINSDYYDVLETTYRQARLSGDASAAHTALGEIVRLNPADVDFQLAYANNLIRQGKLQDALDNLMAAINVNPGNPALVKKATDILMESGRTTNAVNLVRAQMTDYPSPELRNLYNMLLSESARIENAEDPYELYTRTWNTKHSRESLQYLLSQSLRRGYYDDALHYIDEKRKYFGDSPQCTMQEYEVYFRLGRQDESRRVLEEGIKKFPNEYDINLEVCKLWMRDATEAIADQSYAAAIPKLEFIHENAVDPEMRIVATRRLSLCYREANKPEECEKMLKERIKNEPEHVVTIDYAALLNKLGKQEEALAVLESSYKDAQDSVARVQLGHAYKELAYVYLKDRLAAGHTANLQPVTDMVLYIDPDDYWGLRYSLRTADQPYPYAMHGVEVYPDDPTFAIKAASLMSSQGRDLDAINLLKPYVAEFPVDEELMKTYAAVVDNHANKLIKEKKYDEASKLLDSAIEIAPENKPLRYTRGLIYEHEHQWDSAYVYQSNYTPSVLEEKEYTARMNTLRTRMYKNTADVGFDLYRFTDNDRLRAIATMGYSHSWKKNSASIRINYTGRDYTNDPDDGYISSGGIGTQVILGYTHEFEPWVTLEAELGAATQFFPTLKADVNATVHLPNQWDVLGGVSFRMLQDKGIMIGLNAQGYHSWENIYAGLKTSFGSLYKILYFNASGLFRFYPVDGGRSYIQAQLGVGTAPEVNFLTYYLLPTAFNHINSFAAVTASWAITHNMAVQLSGTCNTLYQQRTVSQIVYRNLLIANVSFVVYF